MQRKDNKIGTKCDTMHEVSKDKVLHHIIPSACLSFLSFLFFSLSNKGEDVSRFFPCCLSFLSYI
jgi:hypothetical protein